MQRWRGLEDVPADWGRCVLTIGVFDGLHRGHRRLISRAVEEARARDLPCVLMTFDPHPIEVVRPGAHPAQLTSLERRAELVEDLGVDVFLVMPFTAEFMKLTPERYVHDILVQTLHVALVVVGENFSYGKKALGTVPMLERAGRRFGFAVDGVKLLSDDEVTFSSTYIRSCVDAGDVAAAEDALGRPHRLEGVVVHGEKRGRELGFPTANIEPSRYAAVPADGVYAALFTVLGSAKLDGTFEPGTPYAAAVSVGTNPTFSGRTRTVEAFVIDGHADLYGRRVGVDFLERLRGMLAFDSVDDLIERMHADVDQTREIVRAHRLAPPAS
ncbi:bifunctional riboflavin kinase/FAD synthetase [Millisia brevis]|uniref:bifunctional riboflavin kinase/FAD synthetase n=1 Tax=Millisia brevis TaxID=264148 RepID=UPI00082E2D68|nr:bifunctional riboflavin kinase/FAD synthetase [Millisia brevis]